MQSEAGKSPSLPFLPPMQGDTSSTIPSVALLWNLSSQLGLSPATDTHLKQAIQETETNQNIFLKYYILHIISMQPNCTIYLSHFVCDVCWTFMKYMRVPIPNNIFNFWVTLVAFFVNSQRDKQDN